MSRAIRGEVVEVVGVVAVVGGAVVIARPRVRVTRGSTRLASLRWRQGRTCLAPAAPRTIRAGEHNLAVL